MYHYFRVWCRDSTWDRIHTAIRNATRIALGRTAAPTAGSIDSQSVKTTGVGGPRGYDGGKKIAGRKRHLLVDTQGFVVAVKVHEANIMDRNGIRLLIEPLKDRLGSLKHIWFDGGYNGRTQGRAWLATTLDCTAEIVRPSTRRRLHLNPETGEIERFTVLEAARFQVIARRWVVERTFAWLNQCRRLSKDYERRCETSEALILIAMTRLMVRRLAHL